MNRNESYCVYNEYMYIPAIYSIYCNIYIYDISNCLHVKVVTFFDSRLIFSFKTFKVKQTKERLTEILAANKNDDHI